LPGSLSGKKTKLSHEVSAIEIERWNTVLDVRTSAEDWALYKNSIKGTR